MEYEDKLSSCAVTINLFFIFSIFVLNPDDMLHWPCLANDFIVFISIKLCVSSFVSGIFSPSRNYHLTR